MKTDLPKRLFILLTLLSLLVSCGLVVWKTDIFMWVMIENYQIPKYGHQNLLTYDEYKNLLGKAQKDDSAAIVRLFSFYEFGVHNKSKSKFWKTRGLELHIAYFLYQFGNEKSQTSLEEGYKYIQCAADSGYTVAKTAIGRLRLKEGNTDDALFYLREAGIDGDVNAMILLFDKLISGNENEQIEASFWIALANEISEEFGGGWKNAIDSRRQKYNSIFLEIPEQKKQSLISKREEYISKIKSSESEKKRSGVFRAESDACHINAT